MVCKKWMGIEQEVSYLFILFALISLEKTNMYVTRLPSLRNVNRVVDELGNGKNCRKDPAKAPNISILTQCKKWQPFLHSYSMLQQFTQF